MKKNYFLLSLTLFFNFSLLSCNNEPAIDLVGINLRGAHTLRKLTETNLQENKSTGQYFLFMGNMTTENNSGPGISFAWKQNDSTYILSTLPFNRIRIRFNEKMDTPIIKFRWEPSDKVGTRTDDIDYIMKKNVIYAVIYIKKENWPQQIHLPMNSADTAKSK